MFTAIMQGTQTLRISEDTDTNLDIAKYVMGGQLRLNIVIDPGVTINSTETRIGYVGTGLVDLGAIYCSYIYDEDTEMYVDRIDPTKSLVNIYNSGSILGCNGVGGSGSSSSGYNGGSGTDGCDAIRLNCPIIIHNLNGAIESGGGGGGAGGSALSAGTRYNGGGGGGYPGGSGGTTGSPDGESGASAQYGVASGGAGVGGIGGAGGACNGAGQDGDDGETVDPGVGGTAGVAGIGVNSLGNGVTIVSGASGIIGGTDA